MSIYLKFYGLLLGSILASFLIWVALVYGQLGVPTESSRWIYESWCKKYAYANSIKTNKIIIVSGSNSLFSIDASLIEKELNFPSVNLAIHAGLGLKYILYQAQQVTKPGDIIIAPLEYELFEEGINSTYIDYIISRDVGYFKKLSFYEKIKFILGINISQLITGYRNILFPPATALSGFQSSNLNKNGDETVNNRQLLNNAPPIKVLLDPEYLEKNTFNELKGFIDWCDENGVIFIATYPALLYDESYFQEEAKETLSTIRRFYEKNALLLGTFEESLYSIEEIYDTQYHLNSNGRKKRTRQIVDSLKRFSIFE